MSDERITRGESGSHTLKYKKVSVRVLVCVAKRQHQRKKFDFEQICATSKKIRKEQDSAPDLWGGSWVCGSGREEPGFEPRSRSGYFLLLSSAVFVYVLKW